MPAPEYGPEGSEVVEKPVERWTTCGPGVSGVCGVSRRIHWKKALQNPNSRALAIAAKCYDCQKGRTRTPR